MVITNPANTGVFAGQTELLADGSPVGASTPLPTVDVPGSSVLAEAWFPSMAAQTTLSNGVAPEDGVSPVTIPAGARVAYIHVQGDRLYWRAGGTTINTARCAYVDPGRILSIDTPLGSILLQGASAATKAYVVFM
jgi:hypothetical protein